MSNTPSNQAPGAARTGAPAIASGVTRLRRITMVDACGLTVCLALAAAWYNFSAAPLREARAERNALKATLEPRLERVTSLEAQARSQQRTLASVGEQIARGELQLRNVDQINQRLADLTSAAAQFNLQLEEVKPGAQVPMHWFITMPIRLTGSGEYPDLGAFLHGLPVMLPDVAVVGFEVRGEPEALDKPPRFVLNLVWYAAPRLAVPQK